MEAEDAATQTTLPAVNGMPGIVPADLPNAS